MMLTHGIPKFLLFFGEEPIQFMNFLGLGPIVGLALAVFAEVICAILMIVGYQTRYALVPLSITMLTASLVQHWEDPFAMKELSLLYLLIFIVMLALGPGKYSLDAILNKKADVYGKPW